MGELGPLGLVCTNCGARYPLGWKFDGCQRCSEGGFLANLEVVYDYASLASQLRKGSRVLADDRYEGLWRYHKLLPIEEPFRISLAEGNTPLIRAHRLADELRVRSLYLKDEGRNPTWSFKDRYCCVAISMALQLNAKVTVVASSGNQGASTAAYSTRAQLPSIILTHTWGWGVFGAMIDAYGGMMVPLEGAKERWILLRRCVKELGWYPVSSYTYPMPSGNPYGVEGCKTIAYELVEQLAQPPDVIVWPVGIGEGLFALWKGMKELQTLGWIGSQPRLLAVELEGCPILHDALKKGSKLLEPREPPPSTIATSIAKVGTIYGARKAIEQSDGAVVLVSDEEIEQAKEELGKLEGIFVEAASAATVAGLKKALEAKEVGREETVACILTSSGLKDALRPKEGSHFWRPIKPRLEELRSYLKEHYNFTWD